MPRIFLALAIIAATLGAPMAFAKILTVPTVSANTEELPPLAATDTKQFPSLLMPDFLPAERTLICNDFLKAIQNGDRAAAKKFVAPSAQQKLDADFAKMHQLLKNSPPLEQRFADKTAQDNIGPNDNIWTFGYSTPDKNRWKNAKLTMFYLRGEPAEIDGWEVTIDDKPISSEMMLQDAKALLVFQFIGLNLLIALCGGIVLAIFLGFRSRRKPA
jgi:hypothetical protein